MNDLSKLTFISLLSFLLLAKVTSAQVFLRGKVVDDETGKELAYANISITHSAFGTATDERGNFLLKIEQHLTRENLKVSEMGYINSYLSIDSLAPYPETDLLIRMKPQVRILQEVVVHEKPIDPEELLKEAIRAIPKNYTQEPFNMEFYSRIVVKDSIKIVYQIESIIQSYRKGYIQKAMNISKIIQMRETGIDPLPSWRDKKTKIDYSQYMPGFDISLIDHIGAGAGSGYSVFNPATFKKMNFRYAGVSIFDKDTVCAIEYGARKSNIKGDSTELDGKYNGIIYVAVNNLAMVRHQLKIGSGKYDIIYKKQEGYYFPYFIRSEGRQPVLLKGLTSIHEVFLKNINTDGVQPLENKMEYWDPKDVPYHKEYWLANYPGKKSFTP